MSNTTFPVGKLDSNVPAGGTEEKEGGAGVTVAGDPTHKLGVLHDPVLPDSNDDLQVAAAAVITLITAPGAEALASAHPETKLPACRQLLLFVPAVDCTLQLFTNDDKFQPSSSRNSRCAAAAASTASEYMLRGSTLTGPPLQLALLFWAPL